MYRYTKNNKFISNDLRDFYEENGYFVIRNLVDHGLLDECRQRFVDYCNKTVTNPISMLKMPVKFQDPNKFKGEKSLIKVQDIAYDEVFYKYASYSPMLDIVESIIGPNITACNTMLINKPPGLDEDLSRQPTHQDLHYIPFRPADSIMSVWTAMERCDENNGCLYCIPGSHRAGELYQHEYPEDVVFNNHMYYLARHPRDLPKISVPMEKGDTIFFHSLLLHGSGPNLSDGYRKAISCQYCDTNCYLADVEGTHQEKVSRAITKMGNNSYGAKLTLLEVWQAKARLVRGSPGILQKPASKL